MRVGSKIMKKEIPKIGDFVYVEFFGIFDGKHCNSPQLVCQVLSYGFEEYNKHRCRKFSTNLKDGTYDGILVRTIGKFKKILKYRIDFDDIAGNYDNKPKGLYLTLSPKNVLWHFIVSKKERRRID